MHYNNIIIGSNLFHFWEVRTFVSSVLCINLADKLTELPTFTCCILPDHIKGFLNLLKWISHVDCNTWTDSCSVCVCNWLVSSLVGCFPLGIVLYSMMIDTVDSILELYNISLWCVYTDWVIANMCTCIANEQNYTVLSCLKQS